METVEEIQRYWNKVCESYPRCADCPLNHGVDNGTRTIDEVVKLRCNREQV